MGGDLKLKIDDFEISFLRKTYFSSKVTGKQSSITVSLDILEIRFLLQQNALLCIEFFYTDYKINQIQKTKFIINSSNRLLMYKITQINGIKTYNMSAGKTYQHFIEEAKRTSKSLRYNDQFRRRIELIQDFQFQVTTNQVQISNDQRYIIASGIYGPQIKIFDTAQLSLKCLRGLDSEVVKFKILSDDYSKIAMAQVDRTIQFHAQYGSHYKTRIPHYPRDLAYNPINSNLCVSASANQVYRISLEEGKFMASLHTDSHINSLYFNEKLNVLFCGGDELEVWDFRQRQRICKMNSSSTISHVKCDQSGLLMGMGQGSSLSIFDVRFDRKLMNLRSSYNQPINSIHFLNNNDKNIIFSNKKQIRITNGEGHFFTSVQPQNGINMCTIVPNSGMILAALEDPKVGCFFVPQLGPAPKWVPYIENITEELQEQEKKVVYDEYKFVSKQQVYELGCENLINTKMLKEYMHGYLMHLRLYNKLKTKVDAVDYQSKVQAQVEKDLNKSLPTRVQKVINQPAEDNRFANMMKDNPDFQINRLSQDYMIRHPHMKKQLLKQKQEEKLRLEKQLRVSKRNQDKFKKIKKNKKRLIQE